MSLVGQIQGLASSDPKVVIAFAAPFLTWALNHFLSPAAKLRHSIRHAFHYIINTPLLNEKGEVVRETQDVQVASISVVNSGRASAKNVEIVFNWKPEYFNVWPIRLFSEKVHPDGRFSVHLDSLAPKEVFGLELLSVNRNLPEVVNVRSEQVESIEKKMIPQVVVSKQIAGLIVIIMLFGVFSLAYFILFVLEFALK